MQEKFSTISEETRQAMQADRDAGIPLAQIAGKYGISMAALCNYTEPAPTGSDYRQKAAWPEWKEWDALHEKYGKR